MAKQARALQTYDRVLDAAAHEFARYGYAHTNLQRIADRISLTKGALYGHFSNKEELAAALTDHLTRTARPLLEEARAATTPAIERLQDLILRLGKLFETDRRALAALRLQVEAAQATAGTVPLMDDTHAIVRDLVGEVQRTGRWDPSLPTSPLAELIMAAFFGVLWNGIEAGGDRPSPSVAAIWEVLSRALLHVPGDDPRTPSREAGRPT